MFNVRIKKFVDAEQVQIFSSPVHSAGEVIRREVDFETGEIIPKKRCEKPTYDGEWMECPFSDDLDKLEYLRDADIIEEMEQEERRRREESARQSKARTITSVYDISRSNKWEWFITFTFNPEKVDRYNYEICTKKLSTWLNHMRRDCPDMVYLVVPEQHKDGAYHFHGLFSNAAGLQFVDSGHRDKGGKPIYNVGKYRYGFTTATRIEDSIRAASYVCKYITKDLCAATFGKKRYWASRNVRRPEIIELLSELPTDEKIKAACQGHDDCHIKQVHTAYNDVIYIDYQSI